MHRGYAVGFAMSLQNNFFRFKKRNERGKSK